MSYIKKNLSRIVWSIQWIYSLHSSWVLLTWPNLVSNLDLQQEMLMYWSILCHGFLRIDKVPSLGSSSMLNKFECLCLWKRKKKKKQNILVPFKSVQRSIDGDIAHHGYVQRFCQGAKGLVVCTVSGGKNMRSVCNSKHFQPKTWFPSLCL